MRGYTRSNWNHVAGGWLLSVFRFMQWPSLLDVVLYDRYLLLILWANPLIDCIQFLHSRKLLVHPCRSAFPYIILSHSSPTYLVCFWKQTTPITVYGVSPAITTFPLCVASPCRTFGYCCVFLLILYANCNSRGSDVVIKAYIRWLNLGIRTLLRLMDWVYRTL